MPIGSSKRPKKILLACSCYYPDVKGGGELSTKLLAESMVEHGYEVVVVAVSDRNYTEYVGGIKVIRLHHRNIYWTYQKTHQNPLSKILWHILDSNNTAMARSIVAVAKSEKADFLISSTIEDISTATWRLARKSGIKTFHIIRSYSMLCIHATMFTSWQNCVKQCTTCSLMTHFKKKNSDYVDHIIGISNYVLDKHADNNYFKNAVKHVIHNISRDTSPVFESSKQWIPKENNLVRLGYIGNLLPTKGIETILMALSRLKDIFQFQLVIAGKGSTEYTKELRLLSEKLKLDTTIIGYTEPKNFFPTIDWLVVPSIWNEPFGRVIIEAYSYKVPVIAANRGGIPELVSPKTGLLYDGDEELLGCLKYIALNQINFDFSENKKFSSDHIFSEWSDVLALS